MTAERVATLSAFVSLFIAVAEIGNNWKSVAGRTKDLYGRLVAKDV